MGQGNLIFKSLSLILAVCIFFSANANEEGKDPSLKNPVEASVHKQKPPLLKDHFIKSNKNDIITVMFYNQDLELIYSGRFDLTDGIKDIKMKKLLIKSEFLLDVDETSYYVVNN